MGITSNNQDEILSQESIPSKESFEKRDARLIQKLNRTFRIGIMILIILLLARVVAENLVIIAQSNHAYYQSIAGNQKMLSQRIAMISLALLRAENEDTQKKLQKTLLELTQQMKLGQEALMANSFEDLSRSSLEVIFSNTPNLNTKVSQFIYSSIQLTEASPQEINIKNINIHKIVSLSTVLLQDFTQLANIIKEDNVKGVHLIRQIGNLFSLLIFIVILMLGHYVFTPLVNKLKAELGARSRYESRLIQQNQDLEQFANITAHDVRGPLCNIKAFAELLSQEDHDQKSEKFIQYLGNIKSSIIKLETLIKELLEYSRSNSGPLNYEVVNLEEAIQLIKDDYFQLCESGKLEIKIEQIPKVYGDKLLLNILFKNIIDNSVKYSAAAEPIIIKVYSQNKQSRESLVDICVEDNGIGFSEETINDVFKAFYRQPNSSGFIGSGLGLAICERIVRRHKGNIRAVNNPEVGAKVVITLALYNEQT